MTTKAGKALHLDRHWKPAGWATGLCVEGRCDLVEQCAAIEAAAAKDERARLRAIVDGWAPHVLRADVLALLADPES